MPELFGQRGFQSFGFGPSLDRVVSLVEPSFQPEAQPLAPPFTTLPEIAGSLVANLVLSKSLLRSQGGLTDVYVRVLRIESESSLIRNLNHVNAVHVRSPGRVRASNPSLHHTHGPHVARDSERDGLFQVNAIEGISKRCAGSLASEHPTPMPPNTQGYRRGELRPNRVSPLRRAARPNVKIADIQSTL